ncbi:MAG: transcription factor [Methanomassiliicoccales archaeon PtaU1.Bin124]|nr:MAG: transcription factor [Methanomassiliicoccales archaeon PtaU1.Bin124]
MPCELCGKATDKLTTVRIEGTMLKVCSDCAKFGDNVKAGGKDAPNRVVIQSRLENRERRMKTKDVYTQEEQQVEELADDYGERIRKGREAKGWKQEDLAHQMNERLSLIQKVERHDIKPDDILAKKIEKTLGIVLIEKVPLVKTEKQAVANRGLTLEDFIKSSKK